MDYEKKYKEALERAEHLIIDCGDNEGRKKMIHRIFPELRESEDERIRKELIEAFERYDIESSWNGFPVKSILAYLEKQKVNTEGDFGRGYDCGYQAGYSVAMNEMKPKVATATLDSEKRKEQKPVENPFDANETMKMKDRIDEGFTKMMMQEQIKQLNK